MKLRDELNTIRNPRNSSFLGGFDDTEEESMPEQEKEQSRVLNIGMQTMTQLQVVLVRPSHFDDSKHIANHLIERHTIILNLEGANDKVSASILNFLRGVAFALGANVSKVTNGTYVITPINVDIKGADLYGEVEAALYSDI